MDVEHFSKDQGVLKVLDRTWPIHLVERFEFHLYNLYLYSNRFAAAISYQLSRTAQPRPSC